MQIPKFEFGVKIKLIRVDVAVGLRMWSAFGVSAMGFGELSTEQLVLDRK